MPGHENPARRGWFITIEGPDGGGKTTQAARLAAHLEATGRSVCLTREPGGTPLGESVRGMVLAPSVAGAATDPLADAFLFNAARRQLVETVVRPALLRGVTVVCARFADSTLAYQGHGAGVPIAHLRALAEIATAGLAPDLTLLLDLPVATGLARKTPDEVTRFEADLDLAFHQRVRAGFLALAAEEPTRILVVDATADVDAVTRVITATVGDRLAASEPGTRRARTLS